jgi:GNAT superfamily N-acetyltransferase
MTTTNAPKIEVRQVVEADLEALRSLEDREDGFVCDRRFREAQGGANYYFIAVNGTEPQGTVVLDVAESDMQPELRNMYVYQHARRQGVGRLLDDFVEAFARNLGYEEIFLGVDPDNYRAIPLYISLGYEPTGNHRLQETGIVEGIPSADDKPTYHDAIYRKRISFSA